MASIVLNATIAVSSVAAWLAIVWGSGDDRTLATRGIGSLKYYTVLSNLFSALVSAAYACLMLLGRACPAWLLALKLAAASVVMITFLVTALLLAPSFGWQALYQGGNFWLHLVCPLLAAADVCLFAPVGALPLWATVASVIFTGIYAVGYLRALRIHGAEEDGVVYDFYGFLRWGEDKIGPVAAAMLLATWVVSLVLYGLSHLCGMT